MIDSINALNFTTEKEYKEFKKNIKSMQNYINYTSSLYYQYFDLELYKKINLRINYYLDFAAKLAKQSNMYQKHGAIIVYKKNIIGKGFNIFNNNCKNNYSMHAEIVAINNVIKNKYSKDILNKCELFVVRISNYTGVNNNNILKYSKPCFNCQKYINKFNIKKIYYSTNYEFDNLLKNYE